MPRTSISRTGSIYHYRYAEGEAYIHARNTVRTVHSSTCIFSGAEAVTCMSTHPRPARRQRSVAAQHYGDATYSAMCMRLVLTLLPGALASLST
jgi:hypothetical protein